MPSYSLRWLSGAEWAVLFNRKPLSTPKTAATAQVLSPTLTEQKSHIAGLLQFSIVCWILNTIDTSSLTIMPSLLRLLKEGEKQQKHLKLFCIPTFLLFWTHHFHSFPFEVLSPTSCKKRRSGRSWQLWKQRTILETVVSFFLAELLCVIMTTGPGPS